VYVKADVQTDVQAFFFRIRPEEANQSNIAAKPDKATMNLKIKKLIEQNVIYAKGTKILLTSAFMKKWVKNREKGGTSSPTIVSKSSASMKKGPKKDAYKSKKNANKKSIKRNSPKKKATTKKGKSKNATTKR
jgi:hypothetical protein